MLGRRISKASRGILLHCLLNFRIMHMKSLLRWVWIFLIACSGFSQAGEVTETRGLLSDDASTGISSSVHYTHKIDFGDNGEAAVINGVTFDFYGGKDMNTLPTIFEAKDIKLKGGNLVCSSGGSMGEIFPGGLANLLKGFIVDATKLDDGSGGVSTIILSGLSSDKKYKLRLYYRPFGFGGFTRRQKIEFNEGGVEATSVLINQDEDKAPVPRYLEYVYTPLDGNLTITFTQEIPGISWHHYGLTNEEVGL
jgi:hypothetical protein